MQVDLIQAIKDGIQREENLNAEILKYQRNNRYSLAQKAREELVALLSERAAYVSLLKMRGFSEFDLFNQLWR